MDLTKVLRDKTRQQPAWARKQLDETHQRQIEAYQELIRRVFFWWVPPDDLQSKKWAQAKRKESK